MAAADVDRPRGNFPTTRLSVIGRARSPEAEIRRQALDTLITCYWKPIYKYVRARWNLAPEDARDATQEFFARAMERDLFGGFDPGRARFRTYVRLCVDTFVMKERRAARRLKRGGEFELVRLDFASAEDEIRLKHHHHPADFEEYFRREYISALVDLAVKSVRDRLEASGRVVQFAIFQRLELEAPEGPEKPRYEDLALEFGLTVSQVTNYLSAVRKAFRAAVLDQLRRACGSEAEFQAEAAEIVPALAAARR